VLKVTVLVAVLTLQRVRHACMALFARSFVCLQRLQYYNASMEHCTQSVIQSSPLLVSRSRGWQQQDPAEKKHTLTKP
jgi:hypothetical protein